MNKRRNKKRRRRGVFDPQGYRRSILAQGMEHLEPRLVLDAAAMATLTEWHVSEPSVGEAAQPVLDVVLINDQLEAADALQQAALHDAVVVQYDGSDFSGASMLGLLESTLAAYQAEEIRSLSLVTHGNTGVVHLSDNTHWTLDTLGSEADLFEQLGGLIAEEGSIYLYSCSVAGSGDGELFIEQLATLTGSTVHASDDPVGNTDEADWNWEYVAGADDTLSSALLKHRLDESTEVLLLGDYWERHLGEGNDAFSSAFFLGSVGWMSYYGMTIHNSVDEDWYSFWLDQNGTAEDYLQISFDHGDGDLELDLFDSNQELVGWSNSWTDDERISLTGMEGGQQYYIRVYGYLGSRNTYDLDIQAQPRQNVNVDWLEPRDQWYSVMPSISDGFTFTNLSIDSAQDQDWFRFELQDWGQSDDYFSVTGFQHSNIDMQIEIYDSDLNSLRSSNGTGYYESVSLSGLPYGSYFLKVYDSGVFDDATSYKLFGTGPSGPLTDRFEPNNDPNNAHTVASSVQYWDLYIRPNDFDAFKFTLTRTATAADNIHLNFDHSIGDLELAIYDSEINYVTGSYTVDDTEALSLAGQSPGTYYALVFGATAEITGSYSISFTLPDVIPADIYEDNDFAAQAHDLGSFATPMRLTGLTIDQINDDDWFKFELTEWGRAQDFVEIDFKHSEADLALELLYEYESEFYSWFSTDYIHDSERISLADLPPWTYYVRVSGKGAITSDYSLTISPPTSTRTDRFEPNDETATLLGALDRDLKLSDLTIHSANDIDRFAFGTTRTGTVNSFVWIDFDHIEADLDLFLADQSGSIVRQSETVEDWEGFDLDGLPAGNYQVIVESYDHSLSSDYTLYIVPPKIIYLPEDYLEPNNTFSTATVMN